MGLQLNSLKKYQFQHQDNSLSTAWVKTGNVLTEKGEIGGIGGDYDIGFYRNNVELMTFITHGVRLQNAFGQPGTGAFYYTQNTGRVLLMPDNSSTSGGAFFGVYGTSGGSELGAAYLDNSVNVRASDGTVYDALLIEGTAKRFLLGNGTGASAEGRFHVKCFSNSDANDGIILEGLDTSVKFKVTEAGNMYLAGSIRDSSDVKFIDTVTRFISDSAEDSSIQIDQRNLVLSVGIPSFNWENKEGYGVEHELSFRYGTRGLYNPTPSKVADWSGTNAAFEVLGDLLADQFRLAALNTAPANATDTGTLGEIRIDASYIYVATATDTWKRAAIATW